MSEKHECHVETKLVELEQKIKNFAHHEDRIDTNWYDVQILKKRTDDLEKRHDETMHVLREINKCQDQLVKEAVKQNTTFNTLKYALAITIAISGGIFTFLINELIKLI